MRLAAYDGFGRGFPCRHQRRTRSGQLLLRQPNRMASVTELDIEKAIEEYFPRIHRAALVLTGSPWDADDLAQETFLVLARQAAAFAGRSSLYTWLYGVLLNLER